MTDLWNLFANLNRDRFTLYDGYCQCELCLDYRDLFNEWVDAYSPESRIQKITQTTRKTDSA